MQELKGAGAAWFAVVSTLAEARAAEAAGADVIVAQGSEAGGHRAAFDPAEAERKMIGLFSLLPALVDAVSVPVVATGGIADARGVAAALTLGASAVQIGTGFLRCPEAEIHPMWADAISQTSPEDTVVSRVFSGRAGRSIATEYVCEAPLAKRDVVYWTDLRGERFLLPAADPGPEIRDMLLGRLAISGAKPDIHMRQSSRETVLSVLGGSSDISIVCEGSTGTRYPDVVYRPLHGEQGPALTGYSGCWRDDNNNPTLRRFLAFIKARYALCFDLSGEFQ